MNTFRVDALPAHRAPWLGARRLLAHLRGLRGDEATRRALAPHAAHLSLVLDGLVPALDDEQQRVRRCASGRFVTSLPYPGLASRGLAGAWGAALAALADGLDLRLVVGDVGRVDPLTLHALKRLARHLGDRVSIVVAPAAEPTEESLAGGAAWQSWWLARAFSGGAAVEPAATEPVLVLDPLDTAPDLRAWAALDGGLDVAPVIDGIRAAVDCAGMWTALALARELLARVPDFAERAEIERLAGVAEFNCGRPGVENEAPSTAHFAAALPGETDPWHRAALLDRLSIAAARHNRGGIDEAIRLGDEALAASLLVDGPWRAVIEGWVRSGHAYSLFRGGRRDDATHECETADRLLREAPAEVDARLALIGRFHVLNNLARLASVQRDRDRARRIQAELDAVEDQLPWDSWQFPGWTSIATLDHDLAAARDRWRRWLDAALAEGEPQFAAWRATYLTEIHLRLGELDEALALARQVVAMREALGATADPFEVLGGRAVCVMTALAAGRSRWDEARAELAHMRAHPAADGPEVLAQIEAIAARLAEAPADRDAALAAARKHLEGIEDRETRVRVLRLLADADAGARALDWINQALAESRLPGAKVAPEDLFALYVAATLLGAEDLTAQAVEIAPRALDDAFAWAELPRLLPLLTACPPSPGLARILEAARQQRPKRA